MSAAAARAAILAALALVLAPPAGAPAQEPAAPPADAAPGSGAEAREPLWVPDPEPETEPDGPDAQSGDAAATADRAPASSAGQADLAAAVGEAAPGAGPGDGAGRAVVAQWMASAARAAGLPGELPVMAALVESGLRNLPYGDRDSVGYFQMRTGIWDGGRYAGYPTRPELQLRWFVDLATLVRDTRRQGGDAAYGEDPSTWGQWIADVERPAAAYRDRYQARLDEARALLGAPVGAVGLLDLAGPPPAEPLDAAPSRRSGPALALARRVVADERIDLSPRARGDLLAGRIDPRLSALLLAAAARESISVSVLRSGHSLYTRGGSISNHSFGQAVDIGRVAGRPVDARNDAARDLALALGRLRPELRPTEIGTPWEIGGSAYFTDGDHEDHLHVGYDGALGIGVEPASASASRPAANGGARRDAHRRGGAEPGFDAGAGAPPPAGRAEPRFDAGVGG